jgi:hypothetical protein
MTFTVTASINTTIQNQKKLERLSKSHVVPRHHASNRSVLQFLAEINPIHYRGPVERQAFLYSVGMSVLKGKLSAVAEQSLKEYETGLVLVGDVPESCTDLLGSVYQYLNTREESLEKGAFYTGPDMADDFVNDLDFGSGQTIIDPACGSGIFLFQSDSPPDQLYGLDRDPLAVMIAKFNYFAKFPDGPPPNIFCVDFFEWYATNRDARFDYLIANPPYGANAKLPSGLNTDISSGETFSYFIEFGMSLVKETGIARYLVPDALLNVKRHQDVRRLLLDDLDLKRVKRYDSRFSGLMSDVYQLEIGHGETSSVLMEGPTTSTSSKAFIKSFKNSIFTFLSDQEIHLIEQARTACPHTLAGCSFGLGVVTGDNSKWLTEVPEEGMEPIFSGKEVHPYSFSEPRWFISFKREQLQQVAPDEIYRAPAKLVYKTIARTLIVTLDRTGSLTTNSANIIVPDLALMSPESLTAILNSSFASFLYVKMFGNVNKIGKEHLLALPIPAVSAEQDRWLVEEVAALNSSDAIARLDEFVALELYGISRSELEFVQQTVPRQGRRLAVHDVDSQVKGEET